MIKFTFVLLLALQIYPISVGAITREEVVCPIRDDWIEGSEDCPCENNWKLTEGQLTKILKRHKIWYQRLKLREKGRAILCRADLKKANLSKAQLSKANLQEAYLIEANLQEANLSDANLKGARMHKAKLQGANLKESKLQGFPRIC